MAVNKVIFGNSTLIDISDTTATASDVAVGKYIYGADGEVAIGTLVGDTINASGSGEVVDDTLVISGGSGGIYQDANGYVVIDDDASEFSTDVQITKLAEVILTEDTHLISVVTDSSWSEYDFLVFSYSITLTDQDWIYVMVDTTEASGDKYSILSSEFNLTRCANKYGTGFLVPVPITTKTQSATPGSTINFVLYKAATNYESGSSVKVYGGLYVGD